MNEREGLLAMLGWGENTEGSNPKHEWLEEPLDQKKGARCRRANLMEEFSGYPEPAFAKMDMERDVAHTAICGQGNIDGTDPSEPRRMSGLVESIRKGDDPAIVDCGRAVLTMEDVRIAMQESWTRGGSPSVLLAGPRALHDKTISRLPKKGEERTVDPTREYAEYAIVTDFGILDVVPCIFVPSDMVLLVDPSRARLVTMKGDVVQATLEIRNAGDGGHAIVQNFGAR